MGEAILISFIIPAYNAERTIRHCIESIMKIQGYSIEILLINDGSQDKTLEICQRIMDDRLVIINQQNKGVSSARNRGIECSRGEYLAFVDADDYILANEYEKILSELEETDEIVGFNFWKDLGEQRNSVEIPLEPGVYGKKQIEQIEHAMLDVPVYKRKTSRVFGAKVMQYIYNGSFLKSNKLLFNEKLPYAEDLCFCMAVWKVCNTLKVLPYYGYVMNIFDGTASRRFRENFWAELKDVYFCISLDRQNECDNLIFAYGKTAINHYIIYLSLSDGIKRCKEIIEDQLFCNSIVGYKDITLMERFENYCYNRKHSILICFVKKAIFSIRKCGSEIKRKIKSAK